MKNFLISLIAAAFFACVATLAVAGSYWGESAATSSTKTKVTSSQIPLYKAVGAANATMNGMSTTGIVRARTGSATAFVVVTSFTFTSRATKRFNITKPYKEAFIIWTSNGKNSRTQYGDCAWY